MVKFNWELINQNVKTAEDKLLTHERNNCAVLALSVAEGITITEADKILKPYMDIRNNQSHGIKGGIWINFLKGKGYFEHYKAETIASLKKQGFFKSNAVYIVNIVNHTFTIKNGIFSDNVHGKTIAYSILEKIEPIQYYMGA